jgi:serine/threonine protein phosphatase PrpC
MSTAETDRVAAHSAPCVSCGAPVFEHERFCELCGTRIGPEPMVEAEPAPGEPMQRVEINLGTAAAVSDRGRRRSRNEDAVTVATWDDRTAAVVCDGVASTSNAHLASQAAAEMGMHTLEAALRRPPASADGWQALFDEVCQVAQEEVAHVRPEEGGLSPSTTLVAVVAQPGIVAVANVGDSRVYLLEDEAGESGSLLTVDDSWAEEMIAEGTVPSVAYAEPEAHTITKWIGADAESVLPTVRVWPIDRPGRLIVCTDGLWDYFEQPSALAGIVQRAGSDPLAVARTLVEAALAAGGHDNVTVAVIPVGPVAGLTEAAGSKETAP